jgi:lysophospholipase L1-like esterase
VVEATLPLEPSHAVSGRAVGYYLDNVLTMLDATRGRGIDFFWFPQPTLFLKETRSENEAETAIYNRLSEEFWGHFRDFYERAIAVPAPERFGGTSFFQDISGGLRSFPARAYGDYVHYNSTAQDAIGRLMAERIVAELTGEGDGPVAGH